ncbi:methyltransferase domain-containing protein [Lewinella sp. IMCC34191]|uniref:methyltransferase domain-containing protein n=1 Tax=Lewinella sp. IMCC34191 TaxID=2259172 RepID=UPI00130023A0|nr:methyltransferase domain-containing protein [Lewinella sp. IMCC34191]
MGVVQHIRWRLAQSLEWRWWESYLRHQSPADYLENKKRYWLKVMETMGWKPLPNARVADVGCGPAGVFIALHDRQQVTALDPLLERYEDLPIFSRANYPTVRFLPRMLEGTLDLAPFKQLYCFNAINHVKDWDAALDALTSMAESGTSLLLSSDVHRHRWLLPLFRALPGDALHPQQHLAGDYREALQLRGWRIDREVVMRTERIFEYRIWKCTFTAAPPPPPRPGAA